MSITNKGRKVKHDKPLNLKSNPTNEMVNWYEAMPDHLRMKVENPAFNHHKIQLPCRVVLCSMSGGGKTSLLCETLYRMPNTFSHIVLCSPMANEPLYAYLRSRLREGDITICEKVSDLPDLNDLPHEEGDHTLVIFDDVVTEKNQRPLCDYFIRCRKQPASVFYLTQSFYAVPKLIRSQASHVWLRKVSGLKDVKLIMREFSVNMKPDELWEMYRDCIEDGSFLNIAICDKEEERFRKGFLTPIDPNTYIKNNLVKEENVKRPEEEEDGTSTGSGHPDHKGPKRVVKRNERNEK